MSTRERRALSPEQRFWMKVEKGPECWLWKGATISTGYGVMRVSGKPVYAHRFSYELHKGTVPTGLSVLHSCTANRACVNPDHLRAGSQSENVREAVDQKRFNHRRHSGRRQISVKDRFLEKVEKTEDCWIFKSAGEGDYGQFRFQGKTTRAHRASYEIFNGPIVKGSVVMHACDTPACVRPDHLRLGSRSENTKDAISKGRLTPGTHKHHPPELCFWNKVNKTETCWLWIGASNKIGNGVVRVNGKNIGAARYSWELHNGPIADGLQVLHRCDNLSCVKPAHLFLGTQSDHVINNIAKGLVDTSKLGRVLRTDDRRLKLSQAQVDQVRALYVGGGFTHQQLGDQFGVTKTNIGYIVRNQSRSV